MKITKTASGWNTPNLPGQFFLTKEALLRQLASDKCPLTGQGKNHLDKEFDSEELKRGIEVEHEHTKDKETAKNIAKDHLLEDPKYYTNLKKIHKEK